MASLEEQATTEEEMPLEFNNEAEEAAFLDKFNTMRQSVATERRQSMMPPIGAAPLEHYSFMTVDPSVQNAGQKLGMIAGRILKIVGGGVLGASMKPLDGMNGFDWLFKVQFKSAEELEMFYDQLDIQNDEGLIVDSLMVALPRLDGMLSQGNGEIVVCVAANEGQDIRVLLTATQDVDPDGMIKSSVRPIPADNSFFEGYSSITPGFTHVMVLDFESSETMQAFVDSGALNGVVGAHAAAEPAPMIFSYTF